MLRRTRLAIRLAGIGQVAVLLFGCGRAAPSAPAKTTPARTATTRFVAPRAATPCLSAPREAMARVLAVAPGRISLTLSTGNNSMPQCSFRTHGGGKASVEATANVDDGPQPYFVLERTAIEAAQQFTVSRMIAAPEAVTGLGIEADWFPAETQLMATDGIRLITVSVTWRGSSQARKRKLAEAMARTYLSHPKRASAKGYP